MVQRTKIRSHSQGADLVEMFELISKTDIKQIEKNCLHVTLDEISALRYGWMIRFKKELFVQRFGEQLSEDELLAFHKYASVIYEMFKKISDYYRITDYYISMYSGQWFLRDELAPFLSDSFKEKKMRFNYSGGILTDDEMLIKDIFFSALKNNTFPVFTSKCKKVALVPTDHLDLFISLQDELLNSEFEVHIKDIIKEINIEVVTWE